MDEKMKKTTLEEVAIDYADYARKQPKDYEIFAIADYDHGCIDGFKAGAEWQKEQMIRSCSVQASYEAEIEKAEGRGYNLCKEQMSKAALEGEAHPNDCEIWVNFEDYGYKFNDGDKIKIIIIPIKEGKK